MENNLLLLKPWSALKIWKLGHSRILSVHVAHPECLWRCVSHWLQRGVWSNVGGHDTDQGEEPMGSTTNNLRQSTGGAVCTHASSVLNITPVSSFSFDGMGMETVWDSGAKLRARSQICQRARDCGKALLSAWQQVGYIEDNILCP